MALNFITANETNRRLVEEHAKVRDEAVNAINKIIRDAQALPVAVPKKLFTDVDCVRAELLRKLRDEAGWRVSSDQDGAVQGSPDGFVWLDHPYYGKREEGK